MRKYQLMFNDGEEGDLVFSWDPDSDTVWVTVEAVSDGKFRFMLDDEDWVELQKWMAALPRVPKVPKPLGRPRPQ